MRLSPVPLALALVLALPTGCGDEPTCDLTVRVLYPIGGTGDRSFADLVFKGVTIAKTHCDFEEIEVAPEDLEDLQAQTADQLATEAAPPELLVTVGFDYTGSLDALGERSILHLDTHLELLCPNVRAESYDVFEPSFIAGWVAQVHSAPDRKVRIIAGQPIPPIFTFVHGFRAGVTEAGGDGDAVCVHYLDSLGDELATCDASHTGDDVWRNPQCAEALARHMYEEEGVDVIFPVAGGSSFGVIDAAREGDGRFTFGIDADQSVRGPKVVLGSVRKRLELAVEQAIVDVLGAGLPPGNHVLGMVDDPKVRSGADFLLNPLKEEALGDVVQAATQEALEAPEPAISCADLDGCRCAP